MSHSDNHVSTTRDQGFQLGEGAGGVDDEFLELARALSLTKDSIHRAEASRKLLIGECSPIDYLASIRPRLLKAGSLLLPKTQQYPVQLSRSLREAVLHNRGKLLRPSLSLVTAELLGGDTTAALAFGWAIELMHNASLILDDLPAMDDAMMRRGRMVVHRRHSTAYAILLASYMHNVALQIIARRTPSAEVHLQFTLRLHEALGGHGLIGGQALDLNLMAEAPDLEAAQDYGSRHGLKDLWSVCAHFKTASLFSLALYAGAIHTEICSDQINTLLRCGDSAGLVFQLADDEADFDEDRQSNDWQSLLTREQRLKEAEDRRSQWRRELTDDFGHAGRQLADFLDVATEFPATNSGYGT